MTELKTLKDLEGKFNWKKRFGLESIRQEKEIDRIFFETLRNEVMEWIYKIQRVRKGIDKLVIDEFALGWGEGTLIGAEMILRHIFNISEEDLK